MSEAGPSEAGLFDAGLSEVSLSEAALAEIDRFLPECRVCQFYTCNIHLRCAVHPSGVASDQCLDFAPYQPLSQPPAIEIYPTPQFQHPKSFQYPKS